MSIAVCSPKSPSTSSKSEPCAPRPNRAPSASRTVGASRAITADPAVRHLIWMSQAASSHAGRGPLRTLSPSTAKRVARRAPSRSSPTASMSSRAGTRSSPALPPSGSACACSWRRPPRAQPLFYPRRSAPSMPRRRPGVAITSPSSQRHAALRPAGTVISVPAPRPWRSGGGSRRK